MQQQKLLRSRSVTLAALGREPFCMTEAAARLQQLANGLGPRADPVPVSKLGA